MHKLSKPELLIGSAAKLTPEALRFVSPQVRAVIFDFDNTLADYHSAELPRDAIEMLTRLGRAGIWNFVATNIYREEAYSRQRMLRKLRDEITGNPLIIETVIPETVTPLGGDAQKYKKPEPYMPAYILNTYSLRPDRVFVVGDQQRSDIKSVEGLGIHSILVDKLGTRDHEIVRFNRPFEELQRHIGGYGYFPQNLTGIEEWEAMSFAERRAIDQSRRRQIDEIDIAA